MDQETVYGYQYVNLIPTNEIQTWCLRNLMKFLFLQQILVMQMQVVIYSEPKLPLPSIWD